MDEFSFLHHSGCLTLLIDSKAGAQVLKSASHVTTMQANVGPSFWRKSHVISVLRPKNPI